jgi:hypothetical protein
MVQVFTSIFLIQGPVPPTKPSLVASEVVLIALVVLARAVGLLLMATATALTLQALLSEPATELLKEPRFMLLKSLKITVVAHFQVLSTG